MASAGPAMEARADAERRQPSGRQRRQQLADEAEAELRRLRAQQPGAFLEHLAVATTPRDPADGPTAEEAAGPATHDHDQPAEYLNVRFEVPEGAPPTAQRTLFVLVLDNSGSMAGRAWTQVQEATTQIVGEARLMEGVEVVAILYNSEAHVLRLDEGYEREIAATRATGRTCFAQAFTTLRTVIRDRDELAGAEPVDSVQVLFMTDGRDTSSQNEDEACRRFQDFLQRRGGLSKVSAVGFTPEHNYDLLERVRKTGTEPGVFRYAEAGDGGDALWTKLQDVFSLVAMNTKAVPLTLVANGLTLLDPVPTEAAVMDGTTLASIGAFVARREGGPGAALGGATVELHLALAGARLEFPVELVQLDRPRDRTQWQLRILQRRIAQLSSDMASLILSANEEELEQEQPKDDGRGGGGGRRGGGGKQPPRATPARSTAPAGKTKTSTATIDTSGGSAAYTTTCAKTAVNMAVLSDEMMARVRQVQRALDKVAVFGAGMSKTFRQQVMLQRADMQAELDSVHRLIAQCAQSSVAGGAGAGSGSDTSLMARAADIRFAGTFSKARRQRRMDQRVAANAKVQADIEAKLLSLQPDAASIQAIGEDALDFFSCSLSQANIAEVLEEEPTDVLGFCLALRRVEAVIDAPTLIQVAGISSTLATRSSIEDAIRYNISLEGHIKTHGGFDQDADLGVAVVGRAREPINAWLPLYINKDHWKRVRLLLPQSLGYAVTLDPLGYDRDQLNVLFMLLGTMIARGATTERDARLLFAYMRTVREVVRRFQLGEDIEAKVAAFVESPGGRTKDVIANLFTLFGYVAVLPKKTLMKLELDKLLTALVTESMRRAADVVLRHRSDATRLEILARLVMGRMEDGGKQDPLVTEAEQAAFLDRLRARATAAEGAGEAEGEAMPFQGWAFNASAGLRAEVGGDGDSGSAAAAAAAAADEATATPQTLGPKACRMFASYGRAVGKCMPGPNVEDKTKAAETAVAKWWKAFGDAVELAEGADEAFEPGRLTQGMLEAMAEIEAQIARTLYPQAQSLLRFATFMQSWTAISAGTADVWRELDANDGLAPDGWLAAVQAIGRLPRCSLLSLVELVIKPLDPLLFLRAAMLQAVAFHSNKTARSESAAGRFIDLGPRLPAAVQALEQQFAALQESRKKAAGFLREYQIWQRANQLLVRATDMWAFVGLLARTHSERGQGFQDLLEMVKDPAAEVLLRREKIEVLLTGKFEEASVFCRGNGWLPESDDHRTALMGAIGFEAYMEIERKLRANRAGHVYRESDIPNRHGYCNSHPHDPYHCDKCGRNRRANFWC